MMIQNRLDYLDNQIKKNKGLVDMYKDSPHRDMVGHLKNLVNYYEKKSRVIREAR